MRNFTFIVFMAVFVARYPSVRSLSCMMCDEVNCSKEPCSDTCPYGVVKDICGCCDVCAKGPGEECGGNWNMYGVCGKFLKCVEKDRPYWGNLESGEISAVGYAYVNRQKGVCTRFVVKKFG